MQVSSYEGAVYLDDTIGLASEIIAVVRKRMSDVPDQRVRIAISAGALATAAQILGAFNDDGEPAFTPVAECLRAVVERWGRQPNA